MQAKALNITAALIRFTLEPCNFSLSIFQDFVFTCFKQQRQCLCNYRFSKRFQRVNKAKITCL